MMELADTPLALSAADFEETILFVEDIPQFFTPTGAQAYFHWLGELGALRKLRGVVIGRLCEEDVLEEQMRRIRVAVAAYGREDLPILYGLNFGHTVPICIIPYGAEAEICCEQRRFAVLEAGVVARRETEE